MALYKVTIVGIDNYFRSLNPDDSVFADMILPEDIDRQILIDTILLNCGEFEPLYADPIFMKYAIQSWSQKLFRTFEKWSAALQLEYDPIENYDRYEEIKDVSSANTEGTSNNNRSAYDSAGYVPHDQNVSESSTGAEVTHNGHIHGNIGVTTSQQMLQAELDIAKWSLYDHISDTFMQELCLAVY